MISSMAALLMSRIFCRSGKPRNRWAPCLLIHQARPTLVTQRTTRYHLPNTIGNLVDRVVTFASFVLWRGDGCLPQSQQSVWPTAGG